MAGAPLVGVPTALVSNLVIDRFVRGLPGAWLLRRRSAGTS
jgi:hypothetical protein